MNEKKEKQQVRESNEAQEGNTEDSLNAAMSEAARLINEFDADIKKHEAGIAGKEQRIAETMRKVGEVIITKLFNGDVERYRSRKPRKGLSLRNLEEKYGAKMGRSQLQRCVTVSR